MIYGPDLGLTKYWMYGICQYHPSMARSPPECKDTSIPPPHIIYDKSDFPPLSLLWHFVFDSGDTWIIFTTMSIKSLPLLMSEKCQPVIDRTFHFQVSWLVEGSTHNMDYIVPIIALLLQVTRRRISSQLAETNHRLPLYPRTIFRQRYRHPKT